MPPEDNSNTQLKTPLDTIVRAITNRGADVEIRESKDGYKIYEVKRRLIATIKK